MKYNLTLEENIAKSLENKAKSESKRLGIEISPLDLIRTAVGKEYDEDFIPYDRFIKLQRKNEYLAVYVEITKNTKLFLNSKLEQKFNEMGVSNYQLNDLNDKLITDVDYPWLSLSGRETESWSERTINGFKVWNIILRHQYSAVRLNSEQCLLSVFSNIDEYYSNNLNNKSLTDSTGSFFIVPNNVINFFFKKETNE